MKRVLVCHKDIGCMEDPVKLLDEALGLAVRKTLLKSGWQTDYYEICVSRGGPTIYLKTNGRVEGYWWIDRFVVQITDREITQKLYELESYLDETLAN